MFARIKMNNYRSNFLNNNSFLLMCKHFNGLSSKLDYSSSYFVEGACILIRTNPLLMMRKNDACELVFKLMHT